MRWSPPARAWPAERFRRIAPQSCLPTARQGWWGAAHAGWKGALGGVIESVVRAVEAQGARRERIVAAVGPLHRPGVLRSGRRLRRPIRGRSSGV
ncbi:MAG: laccase domain-containing protein [Caulobacteraceae bacterium]